MDYKLPPILVLAECWQRDDHDPTLSRFVVVMNDYCIHNPDMWTATPNLCILVYPQPVWGD